MYHYFNTSFDLNHAYEWCDNQRGLACIILQMSTLLRAGDSREIHECVTIVNCAWYVGCIIYFALE